MGKTEMVAECLQIEGGLVRVADAGPAGVRCFKGIPYAEPPVGPLRWRPPQPVPAWSGVRGAAAFGPNSMQGVVFDDIDPVPAGVSEDCLYLNVWTASLATDAPAPVMVWIHGGGFVVGSGSEPRYDGTNLAAKGIVVVTVNHRLNALGFLAHPELTGESPVHASGNYGMLDLVAALGWVTRNIRDFGGDPDRITVAGESAGSEAVSALMASPLARGLFQRAIGESGALFPTPSRAPASLADAEAAGLEFAKLAKARSLAELRSFSADEILAAAPGLGFRPIVDGYFLPRPPAAIFADGAQNDVPLMAGWNKDEGFNFTLLQGEDADSSYTDLVQARFGDRSEEALRHYPAGSEAFDRASARALGGDLTIIHSTWAWLEAQRQTGRAALYRFRFERAPLTPEGWFEIGPSEAAGAFHAGEILYVFNNLDAFPWRITGDDRRIADIASGYWLNFIKSGDPNSPGMPVWPSYRRDDRPFMAIDAAPQARPEPDRTRQEFLADVVGRAALAPAAKQHSVASER
jgi:para-nitrobenzyl esterase